MTTIRTLVWCPSHEGHLRYSHHVAVGVRQADRGLDTGVLTTCPVPAVYQNGECPIECVGAKIRPAASFPTRLHWLFDRVLFHLRQEWALFKWLRAAAQCDLVHLQEVHFFTGPVLIFAVRKWLRKSVVLTVHNVFPHRQRRFTPLRLHRFWSAQTMRGADALIVHDKALREQLVNAYPVSATNVHIVPHGVWQDDPLPASSSAQPDADAQVSVEHGPVILFYGTIRENKGLHQLLDSFEIAPESWQLIIAGSPMGQEAYFDAQIVPRVERLRAQGRRVETCFDFIANDQVRTYFDRATLLALPYQDFAAQSGVLFDAICYRVPVVCTDVGALGSAVGDMKIGVVAANAQPETWVSAVNKLLAKDPAQLALALDTAAQENSWARVGELTAQLYRHLID